VCSAGLSVEGMSFKSTETFARSAQGGKPWGGEKSFSFLDQQRQRAKVAVKGDIS